MADIEMELDQSYYRLKSARDLFSVICHARGELKYIENEYSECQCECECDDDCYLSFIPLEEAFEELLLIAEEMINDALRLHLGKTFVYQTAFNKQTQTP